MCTSKSTDPAHDSDAEARSAIEKTRHNGWIDRPQQHLGGGGRDAEQGGREQGQNDSLAVHGGVALGSGREALVWQRIATRSQRPAPHPSTDASNLMHRSG
jgi:hypothetical protein